MEVDRDRLLQNWDLLPHWLFSTELFILHYWNETEEQEAAGWVVLKVPILDLRPLASLHTFCAACPWGPEVPFGDLAVLCLLTVYLSPGQVPAS